MFADDYDPSDIPADQARQGYSYPIPDNPLELPQPELDYDDYDDYDPNDVPPDQAAPVSSYLAPLPADPTPEYEVTGIFNIFRHRFTFTGL